MTNRMIDPFASTAIPKEVTPKETKENPVDITQKQKTEEKKKDTLYVDSLPPPTPLTPREERAARRAEKLTKKNGG